MRYPNKSIVLDKNLVKYIYAVGDIHGDFLTFADDLVNSCKVKNCCVIVCGDIGLGFYSIDKMKDFFRRMEEMFVAKNIFVIFFRGNHDDPAWFEYIEDDFANEYPHIIIAEDFTIVEREADHYLYRILLWGGAISIDRTRRLLGHTYWPGEEVTPLPAEFAEDKEIHCVCTHSAPDFCLPINSSNLSDWYLVDMQLEKDLKEERETIGKGAWTLCRANKDTMSLWVYGHYHDAYYNNSRMNDELATLFPVRFIGLDMMRYNKVEVQDFNNITYDFYNRPHKNHIIKIFEF